MPDEVSLHNDTYPYDEVLADAVEAIAIAQALHREVERLRRQVEIIEDSNDRLHRDLLGAEERLIDAKAELDRVVAAHDSLRRSLAYYTDRSNKWCMYGHAWEAWCDGEGTTRPQRQGYGL